MLRESDLHSELKVAVDYDGTIMEFPEQYRKIVYGLRATGAKVTIITGRKPETFDEDMTRLKKLGYTVDDFVNTALFNDYERQLEKWSGDGHVSIDRDEVVCMWKARIIRERGFDVVFDDAADKIRLYMDANGDKPVLLLKSPTEYNQVFTKWGKDHLVDYTGEGDE